MKSFGLFSFVEPKEPLHRSVFWQRKEQFFTNAITNVRSLMLGALLIALTLWHFGAAPLDIAAWMGLQSLAGAVLLFLSRPYKHAVPEKLALLNFLKVRIAGGSFIGLMYGSAAFLLPVDVSLAAVPTLIIILVVICALTIFQYAMLPNYYFVVCATIAAPMALYLVWQFSMVNILNAIFMLGATIILLSIGARVSANAKAVATLNVKLETEVDEHLRTRAQLESMAMQDCLTGLANRRMFECEVDKALAIAERNEHALSILFVDLNDFKMINDNYGHEIGDKVLVEVGKRIAAQLRVSDTIARIGGDEFAVLLPQISTRVPPPALLKKLLFAVEQPLTIQGMQLKVSASIGMGNFPEDGRTRDELLSVADSGMYQDKNMQKMKLVK